MIKRVFKIVILAVIVLAMTTIGIVLLTNDKYETLAIYSKPVCAEDSLEFTSDICENCGQSIKETGVMTSSEKDERQFKEIWGTYEEYKSDFDFVINISIVFIVLIFVFVLYLVLMIRRYFS